MLLKHCAYGNVSLLPELNEYIPHRNITLRIHGLQNFTRMSNDRHKQNLQTPSHPSISEIKNTEPVGVGGGGGKAHNVYSVLGVVDVEPTVWLVRSCKPQVFE